MSLRLAGRLARRELRGVLRGFRVFLACLAIGVAAIAATPCEKICGADPVGPPEECAGVLVAEAELSAVMLQADSLKPARMPAWIKTELMKHAE